MLLNVKTIPEKQTLTLNCKVTGKPEPEVKWQINNEDIPAALKPKVTRKKEECSLQLTNVTPKMAGTFTCVAKNRAGEAVCQAQITVPGEMLDLLLKK
jgi:hypothetical protein